MHKTNLGAALACAGLLTGLALPAAAATAETYHGSWTSFVDCSGSGDISGGNWNVTIGADDKATVSIRLFYGQGDLHAAWGGNFFGTKFTQNVVSDGYVFDVQSDNKRFVLDEEGNLVFSITSPQCDSSRTLYLYGQLDH